MGADLRLEEIKRSRDQYASEVDELKRLLWGQTLASALIAIFLAGHVLRVHDVDQVLRTINPVIRPQETNLTLTAYLASHTVERNYLLQLDPAAERVRDLLGASSRLHRTKRDEDSESALSIASILNHARERPDGITFTAPYLGEVELPVGYTTAAVLLGFAVLIGNLFVLIRREALRRLAGYVRAHLAVASSEATSDTATVGFCPIPSFLAVAWPFEDGRVTLTAVARLVTGISGTHDSNDGASLIEFAAGVVSLLVAEGAFVSGVYLMAEQRLYGSPMLLGAVATLGGTAGMLLTTAAMVILGSAAAKRRANS